MKSNLITSFHGIESAVQKFAGKLFVSSDGKRQQKILEFAQKNKAKISITRVSSSEITSLAGTEKHHGIVFLVSREHHKPVDTLDAFLADCSENELIIVLDGIKDPHNLGAIMRTADLFGVSKIILPARRSVQETDTVARISAGASIFIETFVAKNIVQSLKTLKEQGFWIYGADMDGEHLHTARLSGKTVLVMGSEEKGLSDLVRKNCDQILSIPMNGHIDSLNVSVAAGILMYEVRRQENFF